MNNFNKIKLNGKKVFLRPMLKEDAELVMAWRNDPNISKWMFTDDPLNYQSHLNWFNSRKNDRLDYIICFKEDQRPIGTVNFKNIQWVMHKAEAGKMIGDCSQWGKGLAKDAFKTWLQFGFKDLKFKYIYVRTLANNIRNIKLNQRLGFKLIKVESNAHMQNGKNVDIWTMELKFT